MPAGPDWLNGVRWCRNRVGSMAVWQQIIGRLLAGVDPPSEWWSSPTFNSRWPGMFVATSVGWLSTQQGLDCPSPKHKTVVCRCFSWLIRMTSSPQCCTTLCTVMVINALEMLALRQEYWDLSRLSDPRSSNVFSFDRRYSPNGWVQPVTCAACESRSMLTVEGERQWVCRVGQRWRQPSTSTLDGWSHQGSTALYHEVSSTSVHTHTGRTEINEDCREARWRIVGTRRRGYKPVGGVKTTGACPADNRKHWSTLSSILDLARTSVSKARWGRERSTLCMCRSAAMHDLAPAVTYVRPQGDVQGVKSTCASRSRPEETFSVLIHSGVVGIWCWRASKNLGL